MHYVMRHRAGLRRMLEIGTPVEFVQNLSDYDETTDLHSNNRMVVIKGHAVELDGDAILYREMSLTKKDPVTLFFMPNTIDEEPDLGAQVEWDGKIRIVKHAELIRPSGHGIGAKVVVT